MLNDRSATDLAMRALRDCGIVRAHLDHPAYRLLVSRGWATHSWPKHSAVLIPSAMRRPIDPMDRDYRLTTMGVRACDDLKPWRMTDNG